MSALKTAGVFVAGVMSATITGLVAVEFWIHLVEHTAYTKAVK